MSRHAPTGSHDEDGRRRAPVRTADAARRRRGAIIARHRFGTPTVREVARAGAGGIPAAAPEHRPRVGS
jgi:hypothetical protein